MKIKLLSGLKTVLVRLIISSVLVSAFFVAIQDFLIFPGLYDSILFNSKSEPPTDVEVLTAQSADGNQVLVWRVKAREENRKAVALVFHGNAEHLSNFYQVQRWLGAMGITSYSMEYRGFSGRSSGWPSESGLYADGEAAFKLVEAEERTPAERMIVLGSSIGTGMASYVARKFNAGTLVLLSPYTSLKEVVREMPFYGLLAPFLKYEFPSKNYVKELSNTCVIALHGKADNTIPFMHSEKLKEFYNGNSSYNLIALENTGHNNVLAVGRAKLAQAILDCISNRKSDV